MIDLNKIRDEIDETDKGIVRLFEKRMELTEEVAKYKIETGKPVFDKEREISKMCIRDSSVGGGFYEGRRPAGGRCCKAPGRYQRKPDDFIHKTTDGYQLQG